jgi:2-dehydro-3-deoxygalactonokinase
MLRGLEWIAVDWGTSNLRCWVMGEGGQILAKADSPDGMAKVVAEQNGDFEGALLRLAGKWLRDGRTVPVRICGMAGAKKGWHEVPYEAIPCPPRTHAKAVPKKHPGIDVRIHAGLKQDTPPDVMRGEETLVAGLLDKVPGFEGLVCLPGTHSKWVEIAGGKVIRFQTFLTGELFALLSEKSVLSQTLATEGWDDKAFLDGIQSSVEEPLSWLPSLFSLRAGALLDGLDGISARSMLSGILLGCELGAMREVRTMDHVALVGSKNLCTYYKDALAFMDCQSTEYQSEELVLLGLAPS